MRIELRDESRRRIGRIQVDAALRPTRVAVVDSRLSAVGGQRSAIAEIQPREVFLNWDTALDDAGQLRRCVACGCPDLFREKAFPQVTAFVVLLAFIGAVIGILRLATDVPVLITMSVVLVLDIAILVFSRRRLVCYRCRTSYHDVPIARYHRPWDRATADRYPVAQVGATPGSGGAAAPGAGSAPAPGVATAPQHEERHDPLAPHKGFFAS